MSQSLINPDEKMKPADLAISGELFNEQSDDIKAKRSILNTIFDRFSITNDFNHNQLFLSKLEYILKIGATHNTHIEWDKTNDFRLSITWENWLNTVTEALKRHINIYGEISTNKLPFSGTGSKEADCLINNLQNNPTENQVGLVLLYAAFLALPKNRTASFNKKEITRTFTKAHSLNAVFEYLPLDFRNDAKEKHLESISAASQKLVSTHKYGEKYNDFLRRLDELARLFISGGHKYRQHSSGEAHSKRTPRQRPSQPKTPTLRFTKFHSEARHDIPSVGTYEEIVKDAAEESILCLLDSNTDAPERLSIPKVTRDAELRIGSKYWIQNFAQSIPWNMNGINPITQKVLTKWISENDSYQSLILALMLTTGRKIPALMNMSLGNKNDLSRNGQYLRKYTPPKQQYKPGGRDKDLLFATHTTFTIQLPEYVVALLGKHIDKHTKNVTLAQALNTTIDKAERDISKAIKEIIKNGGHGLARDRIHLVLRKQISISSGDEFVSHLITGTEKEGPPVSSYYSRISVCHIQKIYDQAIKGIFS